MPDAPDHDREEPFDIETVSLDRAIGGNEGLDVNHASRLRMQFLVSQQASVVTQTLFADTKSTALTQSNCAMARVLHRKFQVLRAAFVFAGIDLVLIVGYVLGLRLS